jgi:hypothetical protein
VEANVTPTDVVVSDEGTLVLFYLLSREAERWVDENVDGERQFFAGALVVEHRFASELARGMAHDGLRVGVIGQEVA